MTVAQALGPYFATSPPHAAGAAPNAPWRAFAELVEVPGVLADRIESVRQALADRAGDRPEHRVAASVVHLGLLARVVCPALAAEVLGTPGGFALEQLWWQDDIGGLFPLCPSDGLPGSALDTVLALTEAVRASTSVSSTVLGGNVASALNSASVQLDRAVPDLRERTRDALRPWFAHPLLSRETSPLGPDFRRASCCLIYRISPARTGICVDCVLG